MGVRDRRVPRTGKDALKAVSGACERSRPTNRCLGGVSSAVGGDRARRITPYRAGLWCGGSVGWCTAGQTAGEAARARTGAGGHRSWSRGGMFALFASEWREAAGPGVYVARARATYAHARARNSRLQGEYSLGCSLTERCNLCGGPGRRGPYPADRGRLCAPGPGLAAGQTTRVGPDPGRRPLHRAARAGLARSRCMTVSEVVQRTTTALHPAVHRDGVQARKPCTPTLHTPCIGVCIRSCKTLAIAHCMTIASRSLQSCTKPCNPALQDVATRPCAPLHACLAHRL